MPPPRPAPCKLTFDLLTLKMASESCVTWAASVPILGLSVLDVARCTRQTDRLDVRRASSLNAPPYGGGGTISDSYLVFQGLATAESASKASISILGCSTYVRIRGGENNYNSTV